MPILHHLKFRDVIQRLQATPHPSRKSYLLMYSTWLGGIVTDQELMLVPIDDHMVHRGDAVFEALKCVNGKLYALKEHLSRLHQSASLISLKIPFPEEELQQLVLDCVRASGAKDVLVRIFVSRGPGNFGVSPADTLGSQIYLMVTELKPLREETYREGVTAITGQTRVKEGVFATIKSCNYLPNVLLKHEALQAGVDYAISQDENGDLAEGSTENFAIVTKEGELLVPGFARTLKGITLMRAMTLAQQNLLKTGLLSGVSQRPFRAQDVNRAREAMLFGTTLDCLAVTNYDGNPIADGSPGSIARELRRLLNADMDVGPMTTLV